MAAVQYLTGFVFILFTFCPGDYSFAQGSNSNDSVVIKPADTLDYYEMSLDQLKNIKAHGVSSELEKLINSLISAASRKQLSTREAPGIVTLITEEDIRNHGYRDLMDILRQVPGLDFGMDVQGVVGLSSRGNWGHEGKILLLIDGQEMNDILWGTTQFGNHYPIENIERIEVIRGPGSSIYGGFAELGVINIVTKKGEEINGIRINGIYGQLSNTYARRNLSLTYGQKFNSGLDLSLSSMIGQGTRSGNDYTDAYGDTYNMAQSSALNPSNLNFGLIYKDLNLKVIYDNYQTTIKDAYGTNTIETYPNNFESYYAELNYKIHLGDKIQIVPRFNYVNQTPWSFKGPSTDEYSAYNRQAIRYKANIIGMYQINRRLSLSLGAEAYEDNAVDLLEDGHFETGEKEVSYYNYSFFTEGLFKHRLVNLTLGARYDRHNLYGDAFNPRIALTKRINRTHFKLLYSHGFRAPAIENINYSLDGTILPEKMKIGEFEIGYQLQRDMIVTANVFWMNIRDVIVYGAYYDPGDPLTAVEVYHNDDQTGTYGVDFDVKLKKSWGSFSINYSYYSRKGLEIPEAYSVEGNSSSMLAFPQHKINFVSNFLVTKKISINPSLNVYGKRYSYTLYDENENPVLETFEPVIYLNLFVNYENLVQNLTIGAGVYNVLNSREVFLQPYNSLHGALPGTGREIFLKLSYSLPIGSKMKELKP